MIPEIEKPLPDENEAARIKKIALRKLFKTPIFERWGKQFCLN